ncbi:MAG: alanine--tRNA ligase, partial [Bacteroidia bacterium]|nr:alanine--tRNA ligase [Bacteroidia bacterium]
MNSKEIRQTFLDFFKSKGHVIVPSAPMVIKNDPTLMFTNAGMNQFKDLFLGNAPIKHPRVADTQKCLRVSGKHNDLEEVGVDTYHHTMFEMLGNWSFGDYFKKEAIEWAWELLTEVYKIDKSRLYVTVFEGSTEDKLSFDQEAYDHWKKYIAEDRIIKGNKKDNFWEMGDTGPCGPCTEIHCDIRTDEERKKIDGKTLVNKGDPQVIEIWNNVFMQYNRDWISPSVMNEMIAWEKTYKGSNFEKDRSKKHSESTKLSYLPAHHVDTGMGFERLCVVIQGKQSNYDTDVFQPLIQTIAKASGKKYGENEKINIAMRVIADHVRAISFSIADGQIPSNTGAGYVIRRILRRAVRYGYQTLEFKEPFIWKLSDVLVEQMGDAFPELKKQRELIEKVIREEETSFFKTLSDGLDKIGNIIAYYINNGNDRVLPGFNVFELYDTFGFPIDLTQLIARENGFTVDMDGFNKHMEDQKNRSRGATGAIGATGGTGSWSSNISTEKEEEISNVIRTTFVGYDQMECEVKILKTRKVQVKAKEQYQLVLDKTPFYAESGGQVGDTGYLDNGTEKISIVDTKKENGVIVHFADKLPKDLSKPFKAIVNETRRTLTEDNHSATHLLHAALRKVLGSHVEQKGSLVNDEYLR